MKTVFDELGYLVFLRDELGLTAKQIEGLTIHIGMFQSVGVRPRSGWYDSKLVTIFLSLIGISHLINLNRTLLHETRHFQIHMVQGRPYEPNEVDEPYGERVSEQDAKVFAEWFADRAFLVADEPWSAVSLRDYWTKVR